MSRRIAWTLVAIGAIIFGALSPARALPVAPDSVQVGYTYGDHHQLATTLDAMSERGPPTSYDYATPLRAVDHRSDGAAARRDTTTLPAVITYADPARLVQRAAITGTTSEVAPGTQRTLAPSTQAAVAAKSGDAGVDLFRHVSPGELADIGKNGFRPGAGSLDGKWFAESGEHASEWGRVLNGGAGSVVKVRVPSSFGDQLMRLEKLDGIGPARYVEPDQLAQLSRYGWGLW